jgi:hypothetical protein
VDARYVSVSCDEVTSINNSSWISIHCYVVQNWARLPILLTLQHIPEGGKSDILKAIILNALKKKGRLIRDTVAKKIMSW